MMTSTDKKIFLGCLPADSKAEELTQYFNKYCTSLKKMKIKYRSNKVCAGYGYFLAEISDESLLRMTSEQHYYKERSIECRLYLTGKALTEYQNSFNKRRVYVGDLSPYLTEKELFKAFAPLGKVKRAYIANNPDKHGKIFGFVVFFDKETAKSVVSRTEIFISGRRVEIKEVTVQQQQTKGKKKEEGEKAQEKKSVQSKDKGLQDGDRVVASQAKNPTSEEGKNCYELFPNTQEVKVIDIFPLAKDIIREERDRHLAPAMGNPSRNGRISGKEAKFDTTKSKPLAQIRLITCTLPKIVTSSKRNNLRLNPVKRRDSNYHLYSGCPVY